MFCKKCGTRIEEEGRFCPNCGEPVYRGMQGNGQYNGPAGGPYGKVPPEYPRVRPDISQAGSPGRQPSGKGPGKNTGLVVILSILIVLLILSIAAGIFLIVKNRNESVPAEKQIAGQLETQGSTKGEKGKSSADSEKMTEGKPETEKQTVPEKQPKSEKQTEPEKQQESEKQQDTGRQTQKESTGETQAQAGKLQQTESKQPDTGKQTETAAQTETEKIVHSYTLVKGDYTWSEALRYCQEHGGYLASVTSDEEQRLVEAEIAKDPTVKVVWLGAENLSTGGTFKWSNGDEFTYSKWAVGEPNNDQGTEHYLVMYYVDDKWVWNDVPDDVSQYYAGKIGFIMETEDFKNLAR